MKNLLKSKIITAAFVAFTAIVPAHAAVLNISDDGQLLGASGVDVNGSLFDVAFEDGTCAELFDGCDQINDFAFPTFESAAVAGEALLDQVLINDFDSDPSLTTGIANTNFSSSFIPFDNLFGTIRVAEVRNNDDSNPSTPDSVRFNIIGNFNTTSKEINDLNNFALFTLSDVAIDETIDVPAPATFGLFTLGLLGLGLRRKLNQ